MKKQQEIWKMINGYEGFYQVSNLGRVRSLQRWVDHKPGQYRLVKERILTPSVDNAGYLHVRLAKDGVYKLFKVHRLVAKHFLDDYSESKTINHKNHNRWDNSVENLEMMTLEDNVRERSIQRFVYCKELDQIIIQPKRFFSNLNKSFSRYYFLKSIYDKNEYQGYHFKFKYIGEK